MRLYFTFKQCTFRKLFRLNSQNVFPNSYSVMKVKYAAEVLSDTVALDIEQQNSPSTKETVRFIRYFNKFFDCLNGAHSAQHIRTRNSNLAPYTNENDPRFEWLTDDFLKYLKDWEDQVEAEREALKLELARYGASSTEGKALKFAISQLDKKFLSRQTRQGLELSIRGFIAAVKFLLREGADFVNARTFSQDHLEQYFSLQRAGGGGSTNPNVSQFLSKQVSLSIQRDLGVKRKGNVSEVGEMADISDAPLPKRARKGNSPKRKITEG